MTSLSRFFYTM